MLSTTQHTTANGSAPVATSNARIEDARVPGPIADARRRWNAVVETMMAFDPSPETLTAAALAVDKIAFKARKESAE